MLLLTSIFLPLIALAFNDAEAFFSPESQIVLQRSQQQRAAAAAGCSKALWLKSHLHNDNNNENQNNDVFWQQQQWRDNILDESRTGSSPRIDIPSQQQQQQQQQQQRGRNRDLTTILSAPSAPSSTSSPQQSQQQQQRTIVRVEKFTRFPFWPAWNGVLIFLISKLFGDPIGAQVEDWMGGRVCPNFYNSNSDRTSPFLMMVHHRHSFAPWDPFRYLQKSFFPEGFPAHPHRGFVTVTYFLKGGFLHRDSIGIKQVYGAQDHHGGKHTQWLHTGAGLLHEEMFDITPDNKGGMVDLLQPSSQELFQIWLNLPSHEKMKMPSTKLLGGNDDTPTVVLDNDGKKYDDDNDNQNDKFLAFVSKTFVGTKTRILAGTYQGATSTAPAKSNVAIFHVFMSKGATWHYDLPPSHRTAILYVRSGSVTIDSVVIPVHHTAYLSPTGTSLTVVNLGTDPADFIWLAGEPLLEPVAAQGSMVMNTYDEINVAYSDYQAGKMGVPWDFTLSDEEWKLHVSKFPSFYKQQQQE